MKRLGRIEGQVAGFCSGWWRRGAYCADIMTQIGRRRRRLRSGGAGVDANHLKHARPSARPEPERPGKSRSPMYDELVDLHVTAMSGDGGGIQGRASLAPLLGVAVPT